MGGRVVVEKDGALGWIVFDHPERRNAVSVGMWREVIPAARALDRDPEIRVVILRGSGEIAFIAGADISEFEERRSGDGAAVYEGTTGEAFAALGAIAKPVIAMIHGFCVGGGMATALSADLRYSAEDGVFAIPAARLGLGYHPGGIELLQALVGPSVAKEIFFTARRFGAEEAMRMGLLNGVFPKAELEARVREIAGQIAENAPLTVGSVKRIVRELARESAKRDHAAIEDSIARCFASNDYKEGVRAFMEKRAPRFRGE